MTTTSPSSGANSATSRRPVVTWIEVPIRFRMILCRAASSCRLLMPGITVSVQFDPRGHDRFDDADGRVVERRVAPDQEADRSSVRQFAADHLGVRGGAGRVPGRHPGPILLRVAVPIRTALRVGHLDEAVMIMVDHRPAELGAQRDQVVLGLALVGHQEHVDRVHRGDRLRRQVPGMTAADADHQRPRRRHRSRVPATRVPASSRSRSRWAVTASAKVSIISSRRLW